jgi:alpha/beta superfamily hydrolase
VDEQDDVHRVIAYVNDMRPGEPISFCAFSLGAAVAMMCAARHANIACMVVDSSFSRLPDAMRRFLDKRLGMRVSLLWGC